VLAACLLLTACSRQRARRQDPPLPSPSSLRTFDRQVANAIDAGEGDWDARRLRQQLAAHPANTAARLALARLYERSGLTELAIEHLRLGRGHDARNFSLLGEELRLLRRLQLSAVALESVAAWIGEHPQAPADAHSWRGILLDDLRRHGDAEAAHRKAVALDNSSDRLHNNLGYNLLLQGKYPAAAAEFEAALRLAPRSPVAHSNLAIALAKSAPGRDGHAPLSHWLSTTDAASAHNNLAAAWIEQGRYAEARAELAKSLGAQPGFAPALKNLQLLADLEGGAAAVSPVSSPSWWRRIGDVFYKMFIEGDFAPSPGQTASSAEPQVASR
jgi:Flp pilus assembly protein TadD